jgi:hypothetical protein
MADEPQIIELDAEAAPRTSAIILLLCGLMGIGFLMVNVVFTGPDPFHEEGWWPESEEPTVQELGSVIPNLVRGRDHDDEEEELEERMDERRGNRPRPTTGPFARPAPGATPTTPAPTFGRPPVTPSGTPPAGTTPGRPAASK